MPLSSKWKLFLGLAFAAASFSAGGMVASAQEQSASKDQVIPAFTEPSEHVEMNFPDSGVIKQVMVKDGQAVKAGDVLMAQDDEIAQAELERSQLEAENRARLEYAQADLKVREAVYKGKSGAEGGVFSINEIEEAKLDVTKAEKQIEVTNLDIQDNKLKAKEQQIKITKMKLLSPFDGVVQQVKDHEGELAVPQRDRPSIIVVKNDPCYVVLTQLTTSQVARIHQGDLFNVKYPDEQQWQQAKVCYIDPVAKAESGFQTIKLELPNSQGRHSGLPIEVKLPPALQENAAGAVDRTASVNK